MKKRLQFLILSLLGFATACNKQSVEMYGVPRIDSRAQGKVTDKTGKPVPGIAVENPGGTNGPEIVFTAVDGSYDISGNTHSYVLQLNFTDVDGPANGEFREQALTVEFSEADKIAKGDGDWYKGSYARTGVDVTLEDKAGKE